MKLSFKFSTDWTAAVLAHVLCQSNRFGKVLYYTDMNFTIDTRVVGFILHVVDYSKVLFASNKYHNV